MHLYPQRWGYISYYWAWIKSTEINKATYPMWKLYRTYPHARTWNTTAIGVFSFGPFSVLVLVPCKAWSHYKWISLVHKQNSFLILRKWFSCNLFHYPVTKGFINFDYDCMVWKQEGYYSSGCLPFFLFFF